MLNVHFAGIFSLIILNMECSWINCIEQGLVFSLGLKLVATMCERLAKDHRFTRSGFPDLIVWNPITKVSKVTFCVCSITKCFIIHIL